MQPLGGDKSINNFFAFGNRWDYIPGLKLSVGASLKAQEAHHMRMLQFFRSEASNALIKSRVFKAVDDFLIALCYLLAEKRERG